MVLRLVYLSDLQLVNIVVTKGKQTVVNRKVCSLMSLFIIKSTKFATTTGWNVVH